MEENLTGQLKLLTGKCEFWGNNPKKTLIFKKGLNSCTYTDSDNQIIGFSFGSNYFGNFTYTDAKRNIIGFSERKRHSNVGVGNGFNTYHGEVYKSLDGTKSGKLMDSDAYKNGFLSVRVVTSGWNPMMEMLRLSKTKNYDIMNELSGYPETVRAKLLSSNITSRQLADILARVKKYENVYNNFFGKETFKTYRFKGNMSYDNLMKFRKLTLIYDEILLPSKILKQREIVSAKCNKLKLEYKTEFELRKKYLGCPWNVFNYSKRKESTLILNNLSDKIDSSLNILITLNSIAKYVLPLYELEIKINRMSQWNLDNIEKNRIFEKKIMHLDKLKDPTTKDSKTKDFTLKSYKNSMIKIKSAPKVKVLGNSHDRKELLSL
jgi:hypothetical protein